VTVREFQEDGGDTDCTVFRAAAIREAWKAEQYVVNEWEHSTVFLA
jgi:hypothetical protein